MTTAALSISRSAARLHHGCADLIDRLQPMFALAIRLYVARVFFLSGLTKVHDWNITLALFENEYRVPLLTPAVAAALGTFGELTLPVLLVLGFRTRFAALALFVFNIVAATSYPGLSDAGLKDHFLWGALLLVALFYGPGRISADALLQGRFKPEA